MAPSASCLRQRMPQTAVPYASTSPDGVEMSAQGREEFFRKIFGTGPCEGRYDGNRSECPLGLAPLRRSFMAAPFILPYIHQHCSEMKTAPELPQAPHSLSTGCQITASEPSRCRRNRWSSCWRCRHHRRRQEQPEADPSSCAEPHAQAGSGCSKCCWPSYWRCRRCLHP